MTPEPRPAQLDAPSSDTFSAERMSDSVALALVNSTYERYRVWRYRNHDPRWNTDDALVMGWMPQRYWEGTRTPRSSLGVQISFDQVEAALPVIMNALFGDVDWFEVDPLGKTTVDQAREQKERLLFLLENPQNRLGNTARNELRIAVKQILTYGNGVVGIEHDGETGDPVLTWTDLRDIYLSPGGATPLIDDAGPVIHRDFLTLDDLESLRGSEGINLPPEPLLRAMADQRPSDTTDLTKQQQELFHGVQYRPGYDDATDFTPHKTLEVRRYVDRDRMIWVINARWVMYNELNPYGLINYCAAPCYIVPGRFYAMGIPDALEGNQKYVQALFNGRLDELALSLNPPRAQKRSNNSTQADNTLRPGLKLTMENPNTDMVVLRPDQATATGWQEIQFMMGASEKRTGVTSMVTTGTPARSNSSRTATGIQAQQAGPTTRLQSIVEAIEDYMIVPALYKMIAMDSKHADAGQSSLRGQAADGSTTAVSPDSLKASVKFRLKASSRMLTQSKLQTMVPFLSQYLLNGPFLSQLAKSGQTVDFKEFSRLLQDATGTRSAYSLFRDLTPQEQQNLNRPSTEAMMREQADQRAQQTRLQVSAEKGQSQQAAAQIAQQGAQEQTAVELLKLLLSGQLGGVTGGV